jgi:endonuclease/exonuclease/phosphatase family metal-dependent hydrolase
MRIYSWNVFFRNKDINRAFEFIANTEFDVFCLQEVTDEFLAKLKTLPCHIAVGIDVDRMFEAGTIRNYVVTLSKHPIVGTKEMPFEDYWHLLPFYSRWFVWIMRPFGFSKIKNRGFLYADLKVPGVREPVRIFNLHLILGQPTWRATEFETALSHALPMRPTIVCGDFNIIEALPIAILNWIRGGRLSDAALFTRERSHIETRFVAYELTNPLRGKSTHPLSRSQLDHILVSNTFTVKDAEVIADRVGSDHHPIRVELA